MNGKYCLVDMYEGCDVVAKGVALNTLKAKAREYHFDTDGECALAYIKVGADGKYHLKDRKPVYTSWNETESGSLTVCVEF